MNFVKFAIGTAVNAIRLFLAEIYNTIEKEVREAETISKVIKETGNIYAKIILAEQYKISISDEWIMKFLTKNNGDTKYEYVNLKVKDKLSKTWQGLFIEIIVFSLFNTNKGGIK